jgi:phosphoribosylanthranilate isomerase
MIFVKVCGLRTRAHVEVAIDEQADAIGFVLTDSVRKITAADARELADVVGERAMTVGVFRNAPLDEVEALARDAGVSAVQLHGQYSEDDVARLSGAGMTVIRAVPFTAPADTLGADLLLVDAPRAGSGEEWDYGVMSERRIPGRWLLAGGLTPLNVEAAIASASPWGVDVSSGIEVAPGVKDERLIRDFIRAARSAR